MIFVKVLRFAVVVLLVCIGKITIAQDAITVKGTVRDAETKTPVEGVTVSVAKNARQVTKTDENGKFTLQVLQGAQLIFSHIGYNETRNTAKASSGEDFEILMTPKQAAGEAVVVQAFKTIKKSTAVGSSVVISGKDIQDRPVGNVMELIQGRVAGLNIQNNSGSPGGMGTITLRGTSSISTSSSGYLTPTSPLFIIDGVQIDVNSNYSYGFEAGGANMNPISLIPPEDIESIEILKDAATTSQYGARATYGVIVITTKRGQSKVPIVSYSGNFFVKAPPALRDVIGGKEERYRRINTILNYDTSGYQTRLELINSIPFLADSLNPYYNNSTDWQAYFYRTTSNHNHNIDISGGDRTFNYKTNLNYYSEDGIIVNTGFKRYGLNLRGNYAPSQKFNLDVVLGQQIGYKQNATGSGLLQSGLAENANTSSLMPPPSLFSANSEALASTTNKNEAKVANTMGSLNVALEPIQGLRFSNSLSYNFTSNVSNRIRSQYTSQSEAGINAYNDKVATLINRTLLNYTRLINDDHTIMAYVFNEINKTTFRAHEIYFNQPANNQIEGPIGSDYLLSKGGTYDNIKDERIHSYGGNASYNFRDKYIVDLSYRLDKTSLNGPFTGYSQSPAFGLRWNFGREKLFTNSGWLSTGSLRGTWGRNIKPNGSIFDVYGKYVNGPRYNNGQTVNIDFATLPNVTFLPEIGTKLNVGLDLGLFKNKLQLTFEGYYNDTYNQIKEVPLSNTNGFSRVQSNQVALVNRGVEFSAVYNIIQKSDFRWSIDLNAAYNKGVLVELPGNLRSMTDNVEDPGFRGEIPVIRTLGGPLAQNLMYYNMGVYSSTADVPVNPATGLRMQYGAGGSGLYFQAGDPIWADINGDYIIDSRDLVAIGNPDPKIIGGFNTNVFYKGFSLSLNTSLTGPRDIINVVQASDFAKYIQPTVSSAMIDIENFNYWKPTNDDKSVGTAGAIYPNPYDFRRAGVIGSFRSNQSLFLENGAYLKITSILLAYNIDRDFLRKYGINSCRLSLSANNVYTFSNYSGVNPENVTALGRDISGGYPSPRTYSLGFNIQF